MKFRPLEIPGLVLIERVKHHDQRGFFSETFRSDLFAANGISATFVQDNHVYSASRGVLRGLHFQAPPHPQGKLVSCIRGAILDVAVDIRAGSPTFARFTTIELSSDNGHQIWLPPGFAHGYVTLTEAAEVIYKVTDFHAPRSHRTIAWDDQDLAIDWRIPKSELTISTNDRDQPALRNLATPFSYEPNED